MPEKGRQERWQPSEKVSYDFKLFREDWVLRKPTEKSLMQKEVEYLGYQLTSMGLKPQPKSWKPSIELSQLRIQNN